MKTPSNNIKNNEFLLTITKKVRVFAARCSFHDPTCHFLPPLENSSVQGCIGHPKCPQIVSLGTPKSSLWEWFYSYFEPWKPLPNNQKRTGLNSIFADTLQLPSPFWRLDPGALLSKNIRWVRTFSLREDLEWKFTESERVSRWGRFPHGSRWVWKGFERKRFPEVLLG